MKKHAIGWKDLLTTGVFFGILKKKYHAELGVSDTGGAIMAENKQYITQIQDNGTVMISEDVVCTIVAQAVAEVEGVVNLSTKPGAEIMDIISKKNWGKGIRIAIDEDNSLTISCDVVIAYGQSVVEVANAAQAAIISAVTSTTGVESVKVNLNVCGIARQ